MVKTVISLMDTHALFFVDMNAITVFFDFGVALNWVATLVFIGLVVIYENVIKVEESIG